jgi:hypothetical protein
MTVVINEMDVVAPAQGDGQGEAASTQPAAPAGGKSPGHARPDVERAVQLLTARSRRLRAF